MWNTLKQTDKRIHAIILLILLFVMSACMPTQSMSITPTSSPQSQWGDITTVGQAPYAPAPSLWVNKESALMGWIGEEDERVFQGLRRWQDGQLDSVAIPVLSLQTPFEQKIYPADNDGVHLLWMDIEPRSEQIRLFSAYLDNTLTTVIAPETFTSEQVTHYTAIPDIQGAIWVVWSGGLLAEPALYQVRIDGLGRPMFPERLILDGDYPVFAKTLDNQIYLYWLSQVNRRVLRGEFVNGDLQNIRAISQLSASVNSNRLIDFSVGLDRTHQYLFWNTVREDGQVETFFSVSGLDSQEVVSPQAMTITVDTSQTVQTGFNSGVVHTAVSIGDTILAHANPLNESADVLPVVVQNGSKLGITYFQGGAIVGYQTLAENISLLRAPQIATDRDRHLYVTWSQPTAYGVADLNFTTTR